MVHAVKGPTHYQEDLSSFSVVPSHLLSVLAYLLVCLLGISIQPTGIFTFSGGSEDKFRFVGLAA